jgi:hypothetical protein
MKSDSMNERATKLLRMADEMDRRIWYTERFVKGCEEHSRLARLEKLLDIRKRASRRLWAAYINELTKIKLGI